MTLDATEAGGGGDLFAANLMGSLLTVASSEFIGVSFIVKKKGLGCHRHPSRYLLISPPSLPEAVVLPVLLVVTLVLVGEIANFIAYMIESAILVTPLGALNIIVSVVLAHFTLNEKLHRVGVLGCGLCIVGSTMIILHAPQERTPSSVEHI
uniref:Probable magnesium transporter n=1 Tax=Zea mays TaxID=4577 RepID=A0A804NA61_MAIZE